MISLYQDNDNPTPIRRKRITSYDGGGDVRGNSPRPESWNVDGNTIDTYEQPEKEQPPSVFQKLQNGLKQLPFYADPIINYSKQIDQDARMRNQIRNINQQKPIWDYNEQYGDNQPIIKAANGAQVRTGSDESAQFRIDNGELIMLPDGKLEKAQGSSKKTDDIATILPQGTKIFSNTLKPVNSKHTFAKLASKHDYSEELKKLENPYTSLVSRTTAERMLQRKQKSLDSLFKEQQALNGDSSGEMSNAHGGVIMNEDGQFAYGGELKTGRQPIPIYDPYFQDPYYEASNDATVMKSFPRPLIEGFEHGGMSYASGGPVAPFRVYSPTDPRLQSFNDSSALYNHYNDRYELMKSKLGKPDSNNKINPESINRDTTYFDWDSSNYIDTPKGNYVALPKTVFGEEGVKTVSVDSKGGKLKKTPVKSATFPAFDRIRNSKIDPIRTAKWNSSGFVTDHAKYDLQKDENGNDRFYRDDYDWKDEHPSINPETGKRYKYYYGSMEGADGYIDQYEKPKIEVEYVDPRTTPTPYNPNYNPAAQRTTGIPFLAPETPVSTPTTPTNPNVGRPQQVNYSYEGENQINMGGKYYTQAEFDKYFADNKTKLRIIPKANSVGKVYVPGKGIVDYKNYNAGMLGYKDGGVTSLPDGQETAYRAWIDKQGYKGSKGWAMDDDTYSGHDYDMRGYWKEAQMSPNRDKMLSMEEGQHFPDTYKLPSHESHSDESKYRKPPFNAKGFWEGENFIEYATGGAIPPIKWPKATSSDSLALYNNSIAVDKFYKDKGYQVINEKERIKTTPWKDMALEEEDMREGANPFNIYKHDDYYKPINDYQFNQRELQTGYLNLESPMPLYDRRINPQLKKTYEKKPSREWSESFNKIYSKAQNEVDKKYKMGDYRVDGVKHSKEDIHLSALETQNLVDKYSKEAGLDKGLGDNATVFLYDPIDIKPDSMLTPEERKIREKRKAESITTITPDITPPIIPSSESKVFTKVPTPLNPNAPQQRTTGIPFLAPQTKPAPKPIVKSTSSPSPSPKPIATMVRNAQTGWDTPMVKVKGGDGGEQMMSPADYDKWAKQNPNHEKHFEMGGEVMYEDDNFRAFKDGGIHINPKNKGKFTSWAKSHGMGVQEAASHVMANKGNYSPATVKRANFAKNAAKWHHEDGGYVYYDQEFMKGGTVYSRNGAYTEGSEHDIDEEEINRLRSLGYKIKIIK